MTTLLDVEKDSLTARDVRLLERAAAIMIKARLWQRVERSRDATSEVFEIHRHDRSEAAYSVGRCRNGRYFVMDHGDNSVRLGDTLPEALTEFAYIPSAREAD
jgi:hypothetical protein